MKHRVTTRIHDAKTEAEGLKIMSHNIEAKLLEVQDEIEKLKLAKTTYEESSLHEKEQLKQEVQLLAEKNKDLSKAVDSITSEIAGMPTVKLKPPPCTCTTIRSNCFI